MKLLFILKEYCLNSSLAGLSYIADRRFHFSERIFWFLCVVLSIFGSFYLIRQSLDDFDDSSISMTVESLQPNDVTYFPSAGVCEIGHTKQFYDELEQIVQNLKANEDVEYNYDVEDFLLRVIFHNLYNFGSYTSYCLPYEDCTDCIKCPQSNYRQYAEKVRLSCFDLIQNCTWNSKSFECCKYFQPMQTTLGTCYLLNSIQAVEKNGPNWLDMPTGQHSMADILQLEFTKAVSVFVINEEDVPHMLLTTLQFNQQHQGTLQEVLMNLQNVVNDDGVRDIDQKLRKCVFPDEKFDSSYKYYSYSTCVTECLKRAQLKTCNCTHFNMIYDDNDKTPQCDYAGMACLDQSDLVYPRTTIMQPWRTNGLVCDCVPSCTEHELKLVGRSYTNELDRSEEDKDKRITKIILQSMPTQLYRRQAVRNNLDIVVSIGGVMGLFTGASILSLAEVVYFFTVRLINSKERKIG